MLFKVMEILPAVEAWRETLPPMRRLRMNHPSTVLKNYMKAIEIKPAPECSMSVTIIKATAAESDLSPIGSR